MPPLAHSSACRSHMHAWAPHASHAWATPPSAVRPPGPMPAGRRSPGGPAGRATPWSAGSRRTARRRAQQTARRRGIYTQRLGLLSTAPPRPLARWWTAEALQTQSRRAWSPSRAAAGWTGLRYLAWVRHHACAAPRSSSSRPVPALHAGRKMGIQMSHASGAIAASRRSARSPSGKASSFVRVPPQAGLVLGGRHTTADEDFRVVQGTHSKGVCVQGFSKL
jgi:hypothetical protein